MEVQEAGPSEACLVTDDGHSFELGPHNVIGRSDPVRGEVDVDLGLMPEGSFVSRSHAELRNEEGKWLLRDLGSSNGTFLVGEERAKVVDEVEVFDGQRIAFGTLELTLSISAPDSEGAAIADEPVAENGNGH